MQSLNPRDNAAPLLALDAINDGGFAEVEATLDGARVQAWLNICPHAGRRLDWAPGQFLKSKAGDLVCAAHGASFSLADGVCIAGPCKGESLRAVPVSVRDGQVLLG